MKTLIVPGTVAGYATLDDAPGWARALLETEPVAHLGLTDAENHARVLPITFVLLDNDVWSAIDHKPKRVAGADLARVRWLRARPQASITVDRYDEDWTRLAWVQLLGRMTVHLDDREPAARAALAARYPQYRETPPTGPLLALRPERVLAWRASER